MYADKITDSMQKRLMKRIVVVPSKIHCIMVFVPEDHREEYYDLIAITHEVEKKMRQRLQKTSRRWRKSTEKRSSYFRVDMRAAAATSISRKQPIYATWFSNCVPSIVFIRGRIYEMDINKGLTRTGRVPSQMDGFSFCAMSANKNKA